MTFDYNTSGCSASGCSESICAARAYGPCKMLFLCTDIYAGLRTHLIVKIYLHITLTLIIKIFSMYFFTDP